ncbi:sigma-70 family RNA polymerase sigma factor [Streptomyces sp. NRRL WC-3618]|uniref:sigma-70 family RNA polymerase sigma factor n=1 Tax=Streptomyces sp. NRRL WC-3618 TaxID=1519490 RepID=UPI001F2B7E09|nr:sigma-70 family RNA polymerase sigma factor [Streptomyces sp. NRRL WC-3618]
MRTWMDEADLTVRALHSAMADGSVGKGPVPSRATVADRLAGLNLTGEFVDAVAAVCFSAADAPARARQARQILNGGGRFRPDGVGTAPAAPTPMALPQSTPPVHGARRNPGRGLRPDNVVELHRALSVMTMELAALRAERDALDERCETLLHALSASEAVVKRLTERHEPPNGTAHELPAPKAILMTLAAEDVRPVAGCNSTETGRPAGSSPCPEPIARKGGGFAHRQPPSTAGMPQTPGVQPARNDPQAHPGSAPVATLVPSDVRSEQAVELPLDFQAFFLMNAKAYTEYARLHLREELAEEAVHGAFLTILSEWGVFLRHSEPAAYAWKVLRHSVAERAGIASRDHVVAQAMRNARATLDGMTSDLGLFSAIAELPERQFDVIVLRYVLGYGTEQISQLLGVSPATVRYYERQAKGRLARRLSLRTSDDQLSW